MLSIAKSVYTLPDIPQERTRNLRLLCLGLPRSGTESLQSALKILGFNGVAHGFEWWMNSPNTSMLYCELMHLKLHGNLPDPEILRREYFDRVLGDKEATTDVPAAWFAAELLQAYPDAIVILNRRRDLKAWKASFRASVLPMMQSWRYWLASWFEAELFWGVWLTHLGHQKFLFNGNFEENAEKAYIEHYQGLEAILRAEGRRYLDWSVEDKWTSLCQFLDVPEPNVAFPNGNVAAEFGPKLLTVDNERFSKAARNACIMVVPLISAVLVYLLREFSSGE